MVSLYFVINICTINFCKRRCRNLLCFTPDARISNIFIFMRIFFHQTNKSFYLHLCPCFKYESGVKKTDMPVGRQATLYCRTCKNHACLWLMHAKVFKRESKTNNEHTAAVLCQRHDFIILYNFFDFYVSHHHAYSRHLAN